MMNHGEELKTQFLSASKQQETEFERRFYNWVRWVTLGSGLHLRCCSAESRYKATSSPNPTIPIDLKDAELFDRAYRILLKLSENAAYAIKEWFIRGTSPGKMSRVLNCRYADVAKKVQHSLKLLEICLQSVQKKVYITIQTI